MSTTEPIAERPTKSGQRRRIGALTVVGSLAAALAVWAVAEPLAGTDLTVSQGDGTQQVGPVAVVLVSLLVSLAGLGVYALTERRSKRPLATWVWIATTVMVVSLAGPAGAKTIGAGVALAALHLAVGAVVFAGVVGMSRDSSPR